MDLGKARDSILPALLLALILVASACSERAPIADPVPARTPSKRPGSDGDTVAAQSVLWERIALSEQVRVRRLTGDITSWYEGTEAHLEKPLGDRPALFAYGGFYPLANDQVVDLDPIHAAALRQAMVQRRGQGTFKVITMCGFEPGVAFLFYGPLDAKGRRMELPENPSAVLLVCFKCGEMWISGNWAGDQLQMSTGNTDEALLKLALSAFPGDAALTALSQSGESGHR